MLDKSELLRRVDEAYARRVAGDGPGVARYFTPDAVYRMPGAERLIPKRASGPGDAGAAIQTLTDMFRFHDWERLEAVVEENKLSIRARMTVSLGDGPPHATEMVDLLVADENGLFKSLTQFTDTALMAEMLEERGR